MLRSRGWNRLKAALQPVLKGIKVALRMLEGLLVILTPLIIILFFFLVIILLDNYGTNWKYLKKMESDGAVVWGVMADTYDPAKEGETYLAVRYPTYYDPEEIGLVRIAYYTPEQLLPLQRGDPVELRHLPNEMETTVMLEQYFDPLRNLLQANRDILIIFAVCWLILAWHPEMLYLGYMNEIDPLLAVFVKGGK